MREVSLYNNVGDAFDYDKYQEISVKRWECFKGSLSTLQQQLGLRTALDVGCGVGYFSNELKKMGFIVIGIDGRAENVNECRRRYPDIRFETIDVQIPHILSEFKGIDLLFCVGLLYHLENPFQFIRNTAEINPRIMLIESQIIPSDKASFQIVEEGKVVNQGLNYIALIPSEKAIVKMLYSAGYKNVFLSTIMPNHKDFAETSTQYRKRTVIIATYEELYASFFLKTEEPVTPKFTGQKELSKWNRLINKIKGLKQKLNK